MKKVKIAESDAETYYIKGRSIPKGCKFCLKGSKLVLFLNGICQKPDHCSWYCPISEERRGKYLTFANEIEIHTKQDLLQEINMINAQGMSITGGEPLSELNFDKTIEYIKFVKGEKGKNFHIHLYTNGVEFDEAKAETLSLSGLDEIRFHPDREHWDLIEKALNKQISVGAEMPVIPNNKSEEYLKDLIFYLDKIGADFINLNEFEYCFPNSQALKERGFQLEQGTIASVLNSRETAFRLIRQLGSEVSIKIHFCSIKSKDYYQLKNRYLRRAKNVRLPYEVITEEGLLIFAQIEGGKKELDMIYNILLSNLKISEKLISYNLKNIKIPFYISIEDRINDLLKEHQVETYIVEMTPFRNSKYQQITEKTPIKVFKEEYGFFNN
ncbi:MAG: radical SAM protein [Candidatus Hodarchaeota archaeon]